LNCHRLASTRSSH